MIRLDPDIEEPGLERLSHPYSAVSRKESPMGFVAGLAGTLILGVFVFLSMSAGRHARANASDYPPPPASAPASASLPPAPMTSPFLAPAPVAPGVPQTLQSSPTTDEQQRLRSPAMVVDLSEPQDQTAPTQLVAQGATVTSGPPAASANGRAGPASSSPAGGDEGFARRVEAEEVDTAHATRLANPSLIVPQGAVISAVLETGINSDLPGFARAVVSRDVSGFDGATVLIPRGSKLIGEYKSGVAVGQSRAFVIWSRLLTPQGVSIQLGSPATDRLGRGGLTGETNNHFVRRFGAAVLLSVISSGLDALANQGSSGGVNAIVIGTPQQATNVATVALQRDIDIPPTITVPPGQSIRVFVARDLDFSDVIAGR